MAGLTIGWEFLTGYAVATDSARRDKAEWPPHPARVFMALAAAWFQSDRNAHEGEALRWLETLGDPQLEMPSYDNVFARSAVDVYVPVNDKAGPSAAALQSAPSLTRNRQPRTFPCVYVGDTPCFMHWPDAEISDQHAEALDELCAKVTRIGHSSSMVRMWTGQGAVDNQTQTSRFIADHIHARFHARRISEGFLDTLIDNYGEGPRQRKEALADRIGTLKLERKTIKGRGAKERKAELDKEVDQLMAEAANIPAHAPVRPKVGLWSGYREAVETETPLLHTCFDTDCLVLARTMGPDLPLVSTLAVTRALRGAVMQHSGVQPPPPWVSGHEPDGQPSQSDSGHLACIPLPFVGHEHADGHLLGLGLVFPRDIDRRERGRALGPLLLESSGQPSKVTLKLGRLGVWTLHKSDWSEQRNMLQSKQWTAHPNGTQSWASVTPVVLDKFPKVNRGEDPRAWRAEVAEIVGTACERIGLPRPEWVDISTTCWHQGSPRAFAKSRRLRSKSKFDQPLNAQLGDGFPAYPAKGTNASRPQIHVLLHFSEPVVGPVILGAGRFLGYGLCKPYRETKP